MGVEEADGAWWVDRRQVRAHVGMFDPGKKPVEDVICF